jgi:hypothetical protein
MIEAHEPPPTPRFSGARPLLLGGLVAALLGLLLVAIGFVVDAPRTFLAYLTAFSAFTAIGLGALAFLLIVHAMQAKWPLVVRRQTEALATSLFLMGLAFIPIVFGLDDLYLWSRADQVELPHHLEVVLERKQAYLDGRFFVLRTVFYFALWLIPLGLLLGWSRRLDTDGPPMLKNRMRLLSSAFLPLVGIGLTFAAFDWMMSLQFEWYSSIFGVYYFASGFLTAIAGVTIMTERLDHTGPLRRLINSSHYYALGRLMFAFTVFWAYITFFQFFIIWMANRPESVSWYLHRIGSPWGEIAVFLIFAHFVAPLLVLLPYRIKRNPRALVLVAGWILVVHYIHMHWIVVPSAPGAAPVHWIDLGALLLIGGAFVAVVTWRLSGQPLLPTRDPDLVKALEYHSV